MTNVGGTINLDLGRYEGLL